MFYYHAKKILSDNVCDELINEALQSGFEKATVNNYGVQQKLDHIRNNERREWDDEILSAFLGTQLEQTLSNAFPHIIEDKIYEKSGSHFRMYRYTPTQYFKPHRDGHFQLGELESMVTVLFYLNTTIGGETVLMPKGRIYQDDWIRIQPEKGDVLLFEHDFWHEGLPVSEGEKYVLRTDLFYRN